MAFTHLPSALVIRLVTFRKKDHEKKKKLSDDKSLYTIKAKSKAFDLNETPRARWTDRGAAENQAERLSFPGIFYFSGIRTKNYYAVRRA